MNITPEILAKAKKVASKEELIELARENGEEISLEEAELMFEKLHEQGEVADEELGSVSGGGLDREKAVQSDITAKSLIAKHIDRDFVTPGGDSKKPRFL